MRRGLMIILCNWDSSGEEISESPSMVSFKAKYKGSKTRNSKTKSNVPSRKYPDELKIATINARHARSLIKNLMDLLTMNLILAEGSPISIEKSNLWNRYIPANIINAAIPSSQRDPLLRNMRNIFWFPSVRFNPYKPQGYNDEVKNSGEQVFMEIVKEWWPIKGCVKQ